jgi:hypothetical protein
MKPSLFFLSGILSLRLFGQVTTWQGPDGFASDRYYTVNVNGQPVPVYDTPIASYAVFDFSGQVNVEVTTMFDVRWVDIRPMRTGLTAEYLTDNSFRFNMNEPANLSLELNGRIRQQPLLSFRENRKRKDRLKLIKMSSGLRAEIFIKMLRWSFRTIRLYISKVGLLCRAIFSQ